MSMASNKAGVMPLVSVIIPIYKVEKYLAECVDSVLNQTYRNLEIILVDDGSPDTCGAMCDAYAEQDERVRVLHLSNGGVSAARNRGMDIATGEFVTFIDGDDWLYSEAIEGYMQCFAQHPELDLVESHLHFSMSGIPGSVGANLGDPTKESKILTGAELMRSFCMDPGSFSNPSPCNKCYRAQLLQGHHFPVGALCGEDLVFLLQLYPHVKAYLFWEQVNYYYRENREGATTERSFTKLLSMLDDCYENLKRLILDVEAQIARGETMSGCISMGDYRCYLLSRLGNYLIAPPYLVLRRSSVRSKLIPVQRPYVKFLTSRPYDTPYRHMRLAYKMMKFSYTFYMRVYLPLFLGYIRAKEKLGLRR